jgi:uncharacterized membrane protein YsdA (DUF1294 family)
MSLMLLKITCVWYIFLSIVLFVVYGLDKAQAVANGRRIPEKVFHLIALAGGFPGGLIGRPFFHHKTRKPVFLFVLIVSFVLHSLIWIILFKLSLFT